MQLTITRLALFQCLTVFYCILAAGIFLKVRVEIPAPQIGVAGPAIGIPAPVILATYLRDYGFLLLLLPAAWVISASISAHRPRAGTGDLPPILVSGLILLGFLIFVAFVGTVFALGVGGSLIQVVPPPGPSATNSL